MATPPEQTSRPAYGYSPGTTLDFARLPIPGNAEFLVYVIVLIVFGAGKIPQLGEGLGKAIKGFKKSVNEADAIDVTATPAQPEQQSQMGQSGQAAPQSQGGAAPRPPDQQTKQG